MSNLFLEWLRRLDAAVEQESVLGDLYDHNTTAGSIREFLVREILRRFLPSIVTIETGKVFDSAGRKSKQIDLILFDARVPCLRSPDGTGLFPIEGVFAAIEVKTRLDSKEDIFGAMENCESVDRLEPIADDKYVEGIESAWERLFREGRGWRDAYVLAKYLERPATYVFALQDGASTTLLAESLEEWIERPRKLDGRWEHVPSIPRHVFAGKRVVAAHDRITTVEDSVASSEARRLYGEHGDILAVVFDRIENRWSVFASHLLLTLTYRIGMRHDYLGFGFKIDKHLPFEELIRVEGLINKESFKVLWNGFLPQIDLKA